MEKQEQVFTISEFGKHARTTVRTLRFYEELGLLTPKKQNRSGHKLYGFEDLAKLQQIQSLKFLDYSLQDIKSLLNNKSDVSSQLEKSLPWQHKILTEKKNELNQAIEAVERVQFLLQEGKPITWTILGSLLFQMENEQDQIEWVKEYCSEEVAELFSSLPKEQQQQMDIEMLDWLTELKKLIRDGASPQSSEALNLAIKLSEITMKQVENEEDAAKQIQIAQESMQADTMNFKLPTIFTPEEEAFLGEVVKSIKADYGESKQDNEKK